MSADVRARVADTLTIAVNRGRPNTLEVPETFEAADSFVIEIVNDGKPTHVHVNHDDDLSAGLTMEIGNHFLPREGVRRLPVEVNDAARPMHGKLRVSTGYGSETRFIDLRLPRFDEERSVQVDATLAQPTPREPVQPGLLENVEHIGILGVLAIALLAIIAGALVVASIGTPFLAVVVILIALILAVAVYLVLES